MCSLLLKPLSIIQRKTQSVRLQKSFRLVWTANVLLCCIVLISSHQSCWKYASPVCSQFEAKLKGLTEKFLLAGLVPAVTELWDEIKRSLMNFPSSCWRTMSCHRSGVSFFRINSYHFLSPVQTCDRWSKAWRFVMCTSLKKQMMRVLGVFWMNSEHYM